MKNYTHKILFISYIFTALTLTGCALSGKPKSHYGGQVRLPAHGNYTQPSQIRPVPLPSDLKPELSIEYLTRTYFVPYSDLFTGSLKALRTLNFSLVSFNSNNGIIEFASVQGQKFHLRLMPDKQFNGKSVLRLFSDDASRRMDKTFVDSIFNAINYQVSQ